MNTVEKYLIRPFKLYYVTEKSVLLYFSGGGIHLNNQNLVKFLESVKEQVQIIDKYTLYSILKEHSLDAAKVIHFLTHEIGLLCLTEDQQLFKRIYLSIKDDYIFEKVTAHLKKFSLLKICCLETDKILENSFVFHFNPSYNSSEIKKLYKDFYPFKNVGFLTSYIIHNNLFIDNLYLPHRGWPCHFCFINRWMQNEYSNKGISKNSWFYITNFLMKENIKIPLSLPAEDIDLNFTFFWLKQEINKVFGIDKTSVTSCDTFFTSVDLSNGTIKRDINPHWPGCNCLTGAW